MYAFQAVMALQIIAFVFRGFFEPPLDFFAGLFAVQSEFHLLLNLMMLGFYGKALEEGMGTNWFATTYVAGALMGGLVGGAAYSGFHGTAGLGASAGIMALMGTIIAMQPLAWIVAEYIPVPAFLAGAFYILARFLVDQSLDVIPLLVGLAFGYVIKESREGKPAAPSAPMGRPYA